MTNLLATIIITLNTNWVSQTKVVPFCHLGDGCQIKHTQLVKQIGTITTNTVAEIEFEGRKIQMLLKTEDEKMPSQQREIVDLAELHQQAVIFNNLPVVPARGFFGNQRGNILLN